MTVLETASLTKRYGRITAVNELNLSIPSGEVFGLLGPNGSGKTTTLGMVLGVIRPTLGNFTWFDGISGSSARKKVGAILEQPIFYPHLSGAQNLKIAAKIKEKGLDRIDEVLQFVGLGERGRDPFKNYSLGMKQRLAIASALVADPDVLILDEPTNGLDPEGIHDIRRLITEIAASGKTIILASHLLDEVQKVCSEYAVLQSGKCIHKGNVAADLAGNGGWELASEDLDALQTALSETSFVKGIKPTDNAFLVQIDPSISGSEINKSMMDKGLILSQLAERRNTLEEKFLELLKSQS
ncbi:MAG: ATP-binding cassette domain-containing protein [Bacteroidetes bacterium]|nr:MAG: ATP-binding cassette domain-containing protein [Bacteroidota bacterium]